jgi:hypothetical protein
VALGSFWLMQKPSIRSVFLWTGGNLFMPDSMSRSALFCSGLAISLLLARRLQMNRLYAFDLLAPGSVARQSP